MEAAENPIMVSITDFDGRSAPVLLSRRLQTRMLAAGGTGLALLLAFGGAILRGGGANGMRFGAGLVLVVSSLAFVIAYIAQPLCRLVPTQVTRALGRERTGLTQAFACMYAVFLLCIVYTGAYIGEPLGLPTLAFAIFSTAILAVMVFGTSTRRILGSSAGRAVLALSTAYFWSVFAVNDLSHLVGPRRADWLEPLYELSLTLLVLALVLRFADAFMERRKVRMAEAL
jgi:hypothetical protein